MDAFEEQRKRNRARLWFLKWLLLLGLGLGFVELLHAAPPCDCVASDYYALEPLPLASIVTSCPDWPAAALVPGVRSITAGAALSQYQGELYLNSKSIPYADGSVAAVRALIKGEQQDCQQTFHVGDQALSGWNLVLLPRWYTVSSTSPGRGGFTPLVRLKDNLLATLPGSAFLSLEEIDALTILGFFASNGVSITPSVAGVDLMPYPAGFRVSGSPDPVYAAVGRSGGRAPPGAIASKALIADIRSTLKANGWTNFDAGMVEIKGQWFPAIVKLFGTPGKVYAYYGRFKDAEEAKRYGLTTTDQLYFSKRELVPPEETEYFESDLRFGNVIFSRDQVLPNRRFLEWHSECRCSDQPFNPDDRNVAKVEAGGNWTPIAPDNAENSNPLMFRECPDARTYFHLYQTCVENQMKEDHPPVTLNGRVDYSDYVASKMGAAPVYKSVNPDGTIEGEDLSVDNMPETPAYYDHSGERLNPTSSDLMDPLDPNTVFYGFRYGPKSLTDWEGPKRQQFLINPRIRAVVTDMQGLFDTKVSQGKEALLALFNINFAYGAAGAGGGAGPSLTGPITATGKFGSLDLNLSLDDPASLNLPIKILNPYDKYLEYKTARTFITQSQSGKPLRIHIWVDGKEWDDYVLGSDLDDQHYMVYWVYGVYAFDRHGDPTQIGTLRVSNVFWVNKDEPVEKLVGKWMDEVLMQGGSTLSSADAYDLSSREAHTDLKSLHERDPVTFEEKSEAAARIAYYIAVSEGLDMAMKWLYQQKDKPYIYEAAKRVENMVAVKQTAKVAYAFYKGYVEWRRLMDILAEIRDSRRSLERAYSRFKRSGSLLVDYLVNLDYKKIRPTNVADLFPTRAMRYFDWSAMDLKNELVHFEASLHALNLDLDRFMDGPGKQTLAYLYRETSGSLAQVTAQNDHDRETTHSTLQTAQGALKRSDDNTSNYLRLSALTRLALQKTRNTELKSLEASTTGLRNVLLAIQSDSRDWLTMQDYMTHNLAGSPGSFLRAYQNKDPDAVAHQFDVHPIFRNPWVDDHAGSGP